MSDLNASRRLFFKHTFMAAAGGMLLNALGGQTASAQAKPELIDMTEKVRKDPLNKACVSAAKGINYRDKATDLSKDIKSGKIKATVVEMKDKAGKNIPIEKRDCSKCALFAMTDPKLNTCILINGCLVQPGGSCLSWSLKPGML